ncbi:tetratricopeptide repeat protein [Streptomyces anulatus]|uniref:tetratricopeptide repeat protein n=1 Tax=Streptomyces anulatus TaxID=1892 RepID=UPI002F914AF9
MGEGTAVSGYRGPVPGSGGEPVFPVRVSRTGPATSYGGFANSGYIHEVVVQQAPREPAPWPHQVGAIPAAAQSFQHRTEANRLREAVEGGGTAVLSQVLTGMGGVGKTQLAADYARTAQGEGNLDVLVWITASDRSSAVSGYAQAGIELCRADPDDPEQAARTFLAWLAPKAGQQPCRWLIVLDDVADPNDLIGHPENPGNHFSLWPPASPHGQTLLTTRRRDAALFGQDRRRIDVGLFTPAESAAYFTAALHAQHRADPEDQITALAAELGHLPLALAQAAAYLLDAGITAAGYRDLLADRATHLADLAPDSLPDEQATALAAAWSLSLDRADSLRPAGLARPMLHLASLLDANGIPQTVLTSEPARLYLVAHRTATDPGPTRPAEPWQSGPEKPSPVTVPEAVGALRSLHRLSLISHDPSTPHPTVRVHQLIQRTTRDTHAPDQHHEVARTTADALTETWPEIERDADLGQALRASTAALIRHAENALYRPDAHEVLHRLGESLSGSGQVTAANNYYEHFADTVCRHLGPDHPDTIATRSILASSRGEAGDVAGAVEASADLLEHMVRVLGPDHPSTLITRSNLAHWRGEAGDVAGAMEAFADLLADQVRVLGPDHPNTLITRNNLTQWRGEAGDVAGAMEASADLLADQVRVLGPDHPNTLITRSNLAHWREKAGDAAGAMEAFVDLLERMERVLGPDHPNTLTTRNNLANSRGEAGDVAGAMEASADLLADQVRVLGPDHPNTIATRNSLAYWRGEAGDAAEAAEAFADLLADQVRVLGPDHPDTLATRNSLAYWRGEAGDAAEAAEAFADLLADQVRVLGPDHPSTLITRNNLAYWRGEAGDAAEAAEAFADLLADQVRVLGPDHPNTLTTRNNLASSRGEAGDVAGAMEASADLLADRVRVLGPDHPDTLITRSNLVYWREKAGDVAGAMEASADLLADRVRVLGPDHPDTLITRNNLAQWREKAGDVAGAMEASADLLADQVRVLGPDHPDTPPNAP